MYLSWGERPVYFPVLTDNDSVDVKIPSFFSVECCISFATGRFRCIFLLFIPNSFSCSRNLGFSDNSDNIFNLKIKIFNFNQDF